VEQMVRQYLAAYADAVQVPRFADLDSAASPT
jgi:hypothetical protein